MSSVIDRALAGALADAELAAAAREKQLAALTAHQRYALDPLAPLEDGHIRIWDKEKRAIVRLEPYDYQREALEGWIDVEHLQQTGSLRFRNLIGEKSRQVGFTWIFAYGAWWAVNYHAAQGIVKARKSSEMDDGGARSTWRSFLGKIRFIYRHIEEPEALGRARLRFVGGTEPKVVNEERPDSFILGEGETADPGRGGTFTFGVLDEAGYVAWGESVHAALSQACPDGLAYISTPNGKDNVHYRLISQVPIGWRKLRAHWSQHPVYSRGLHLAGELEACELCLGTQAGIAWDPHDPKAHRYPDRLSSPWYEATIADMTDEQVARELDIDYEASVAARVYPGASRELHLAKGPLRYDPLLPLELGFDYGVDFTAVVLCQDHPSEYRVIGYLKASDQAPDQVAVALRELAAELGVGLQFLTPHWTRQWYCVGDPSGESREVATLRTTAGEYRRLGFAIDSPRQGLTQTINAVSRLLRGKPKRLVVSPASGGEQFLDDLIANKWPTDRTGARKQGARYPEDTPANHGARAFAYLVCRKFPPPVEEDDYEVPPDRDASSGVGDSGLRYGMTL